MNPTIDLGEQLNATLEEFEELITSFSQEELNRVPFTGSWTGGQVAHHVLLSQEGIVKTIHGRTAVTDRPPGKNVKTLNDIFLDFGTKFKSPEFIDPGPGPYQKDELLNRLKVVSKAIKNAVETLDLGAVCLSFELPGVGKMTRLEWVHFFLVHTQRHLRQMTNILATF